jgi:L-ascorbate metabolism protein UlaG (beta-lactamase superfamily)
MRFPNLLAIPLLALLPLVSGCSGRSASSNTTSYREVRVDWLGQQSYRITSSLGTSIITNPYVEGFPPDLEPDIVLITTGRGDSNNIDAFENTPTVFRGLAGTGLYSAKGTRIRGIPIYKDPSNESPEGMSLVFLWRMEGMHLCFIENLQQQSELTPAQLKQIGPADILFAPANDLGKKAASQLNARIVIPIGPDGAAMARTFPKKVELPGGTVSFSIESLQEKQTAIAFEHPRR